MTAAPYPRHQAILGELHFWIRSFLGQHRLGRVFFAPVDVLLSKHDIVQPDLLFISNERLTTLTEKNVQGAPDLVIEVLSPSTRRIDEGLKLERYELLDVREYWTVDPSRNVVRVYRRSGDRLRKEAELTAAAGDRLTTPLLPGLEIRSMKSSSESDLSEVAPEYGPERAARDRMLSRMKAGIPLGGPPDPKREEIYDRKPQKGAPRFPSTPRRGDGV